MEPYDASTNIVEEIDTEKLVATIITQTDYSKEVALEKLKIFNYNPLNVIRDYLGTNNTKNKPKSLNQQIYSEFRKHLY
tara:strand:- start:111 stop:347 length:237 start_codon:yes stop_codon:yes gene_type:complete